MKVIVRDDGPLPMWWLNFVNSNEKINFETVNLCLAKHNARFDGYNLWFDRDSDFTMFILRFG